MLKVIEQLISGERHSVGNHRCITSIENGHIIDRYYYYSTAVCTVDITTQRFKTDEGGWGTHSTSRAINDYRSWFKDCYCEVFDKFGKLLYALVNNISDKFSGTMYRCYYGDVDVAHTQVTVTKRTLGDEKFAVIEIANDTEDTVHTYTIKYKGRKSLETEIKNSIGHFFSV